MRGVRSGDGVQVLPPLHFGLCYDSIRQASHAGGCNGPDPSIEDVEAGDRTQTFRWPAKDTTLAEKIDELKKRDSLVAFEPCELKLKLKVNGTTNHALVLNSDQLQ